MDGRDLVKLAAEFAAGGVSASYISEHYGDGVLSSVLALAAGTSVGYLTGKALDVVDEHTGVVSGLGSVVDDVLDIFKW